MKIICFIIPLICFQAVAQNKTVIDKVDGFSTYKFGMSKTSCGCNVTEENKDDWWCESIYPKNLSVGEFLVSHLDMAFGSNGLEKIIVNFKNPNKEKLLAKLTEKYGKPLIEYKNEAYSLFLSMTTSIRHSVVYLIFRSQPILKT